MSDKQGTPILPPLSRGAANNGGSNGGTPQQTVSLQQVLATAQGLNVLATGSGQQFVITTQVPGLTQVNPYICLDLGNVIYFVKKNGYNLAFFKTASVLFIQSVL